MAESGVGKALQELDSVPVKRVTGAPVAPIPSAPVSLPTSDPLKVQRALDVARPRVKPVLRIDNPGGEWLKNQRRYAEEGKAKVSGPVTGYFNKPIELDPRKLESIPGAMNEQRAPGDLAYDHLRPLIEKQGFLQDRPILVGINHLGAPYIIEGNTRAAVARDLGIDRIPADVRYFAGGEGIEGPMMPSRLEEFMPPSKLSLDPNFRRFFEGSQAVDEYGEPLRMYHGTRNDFLSFDPNMIGQRFPMSNGFYFVSRPERASVYADSISNAAVGWDSSNRFAKPVESGANVIPAYLNLQNPMIIQQNRTSGGLVPEDIVDSNGGDIVKRAREAGHDGLMVKRSMGDKFDETFGIVFSPTQIKSAIGNRGTYDPNIPDITKAAGGRAKTPDWQRAAGKNPEGGLNAKGRASYNRDNPDKPGLKRPQPEGGARRDSFCSRMEGMKDKLTSKETASDPNSRINKSLRAWNC